MEFYYRYITRSPRSRDNVKETTGAATTAADAGSEPTTTTETDAAAAEHSD